MSNDRYQKIRDALAMGPTPGPWSVAVRNIPWSMADGSTGVHVERIILTGWDHPQAHGPVSVVSKWLGIGEEGGPGAQFVRIQEADARLIAACDPDTAQALLDERDALEAENEQLRAEIERLRGALEECHALSVERWRRLLAAEAENERLREALREAQPFIGWTGSYPELHAKIDALLRGQLSALDSPAPTEAEVEAAARRLNEELRAVGVYLGIDTRIRMARVALGMGGGDDGRG